jgi:hypothetical protein
MDCDGANIACFNRLPNFSSVAIRFTDGLKDSPGNALDEHSPLSLPLRQGRNLYNPLQ